MPNMWVELTAIQRMDRGGRIRTLHPGDRVYISLFHALNWINSGTAVPLDKIFTLTGSPSGNCGIVTKQVEIVRSIVKNEIQVIEPGHAIFQKTLYLDGPSCFRFDLLTAGFNIIERWQCAVPLWSYTELANQIGTEEEREKTRVVIRDLRVPYYDTRVMFVRDCQDTRRLMELWGQERIAGGDDRLAFLRALYQVKPTICALPVEWAGKAA